MKLNFLYLILFFTSSLLCQQNSREDIGRKILDIDYPEGIYKSKEDFLNKTPDSSLKIVKKDFGQNRTDGLIIPPFFYDSNKDKKIKKVFAISYEGDLYFQIRAILDNRNKEDRAQDSNSKNGFAKVIIGGKNYLYAEAPIVNKWGYAVALNTGENTVNNAISTIKGKGVVWDFVNREFNIFRTCEDYNTFISDKLPDAKQKCEFGMEDILEIRKAVQVIK
ncbi:hypothetical protein [Dokdonia sinensis]|nr:hypothetical protein [Dokdonia sinensis]